MKETISGNNQGHWLPEHCLITRWNQLLGRNMRPPGTTTTLYEVIMVCIKHQNSYRKQMYCNIHLYQSKHSIYTAFRKYSDPFTFSKYYYVIALSCFYMISIKLHVQCQVRHCLQMRRTECRQLSSSNQEAVSLLTYNKPQRYVLVVVCLQLWKATLYTRFVKTIILRFSKCLETNWANS